MKDLNIATIETFTTWPDGWRGFRKYEGVCAFKLAYSYNSASIFNFSKYDHRFFTNLVFMAFHNSDNVSLHRTPTIAFHFFKKKQKIGVLGITIYFLQMNPPKLPSSFVKSDF